MHQASRPYDCMISEELVHERVAMWQAGEGIYSSLVNISNMAWGLLVFFSYKCVQVSHLTGRFEIVHRIVEVMKL